MLAWCTVEVIRYNYYALNLFNAVPSVLNWLRYSAFLVLYPVGVSGELGSLYHAFPVFANGGCPPFWKGCNLALPNKYNISYSSAGIAVLFVIMYLPGFPFLYMQMMSERSRRLASKPKPKAE